MHTIVNHLPISPDADWADMAAKFETLANPSDPAQAAIRTLQLVKASETEAILVVTFDDLETLKEFSSNVAGPWFAQNLKQYLAGPANRIVGEVVAGFA